MAKKNISENEELGRRAIFIASIVIGIISTLIVYNALVNNIILSLMFGIILSVINPFLGGLSVRISEELHRIAFPDTYESWDIEKKLWMGTFWPFTLLFWIVMFIFFSTINRVFR